MTTFNDQPDDAHELNRTGEEFLASQNYEQARDRFMGAIAIDETLESAHYNLGLVWRQLHEMDKARVAFERALEIKPDYLEAMNQLGILWFERGEYDRAERYYQQALSVNDRLDYVYYNLSLVEEARGNGVARRELLEKALKLTPNYSIALNALGNYYYTLADYGNARTCYQKALRADPANKQACYNMGLLAEIDCDFERARQFYEKSLAMDPGYDLAIGGLAGINKKISEEKNLMETAVPKPVVHEQDGSGSIDAMGRNLTRLAREGKLKPALGRDREIDTMFEVLHKRFKNNPLLIGNPGVGKTAIVEGIAVRIATGSAPGPFLDKEIIEINTGLLLAGTKYRGDFERRISRILDESRNNDRIILFIDEIHTIIGAGSVEDSNLDLAQMLKPALQNGEITVIGATTTNEYRKYIEKDPALERRFYPVVVEELSPAATAEILYNGIDRANEHYHIAITRRNVDDIVALAAKYIKKRHFPDKAIDVFEKLAARMSLAGKKDIVEDDIKAIIAEMTGAVFIEQDQEGFGRLANLEAALGREIFGQDDAIRTVCSHLHISKRRLDLRPERPDGVFLFTGPSGTGKTWFAKCLCRQLYGDEHRLIRLDMSEYAEPQSVARLIGAPPGYVGYDDVPALTASVEDNPSSILLLDEIEKAHPDVVRLFLQVFDEGRITDSKGKKAYFSDITIIMTSNALARGKTAPGFINRQSGPKRNDSLAEALSGHFPKEFLNRIDEIVLFKDLTRADARHICREIIIPKALDRFRDEHIALSFDDSVVEYVLDKGYSPEQGARNLEHAFERLVLAPLVKYIVESAVAGASLSIVHTDKGLGIKKRSPGSGIREKR